MIEEIIYKESCYINNYTGDDVIIQNHIDHLLSFDEGRVRSNNGGFQSNNITFGFHDLIKFALESLASIDVKCQLASFWLNVNDGKSSNHPHIHEIDGWSAVYYHKVCCAKSTLNFHSLVPTIIRNESHISPQEKMMIFFPGNMPHSVSSCHSENHKRITLAFNFIKL
tara:strand:- start:39 stop:542 length:504 start_codon:yes stop_codon:yes gene_type:complete